MINVCKFIAKIGYYTLYEFVKWDESTQQFQEQYTFKSKLILAAKIIAGNCNVNF